MTGDEGPAPGPGKPPDADRDRSAARTAGVYAGLGIQFALSILIFLYAGDRLDRKLGTAPWFLFIGVIVGSVGGFTAIYRRLMADLRREEEARRRAKGEPPTGAAS